MRKDHVFVSYSRRVHAAQAFELSDLLKQRGLEVWLDRDQLPSMLEDELRLESILDEAIGRCKVLAFFDFTACQQMPLQLKEDPYADLQEVADVLLRTLRGATASPWVAFRRLLRMLCGRTPGDARRAAQLERETRDEARHLGLRRREALHERIAKFEKKMRNTESTPA